MLLHHYANIQMSQAHHTPIPLLVEKSPSLHPQILPLSFVLDEDEIKHIPFSFKVTYTLSVAKIK